MKFLGECSNGRLCQPACCIDGRPLLRTDKLCPGCCAVTAGKYAVGENKADQQAKLYEGVNNTLEPVLRLLAIFTIGVPQTESAIPMAHWLPLVLSSLLCLGGSLLYASVTLTSSLFELTRQLRIEL